MLKIEGYTGKRFFSISNPKIGFKVRVGKSHLINKYKLIIPWARLYVNDKEVDYKKFVSKFKL